MALAIYKNELVAVLLDATVLSPPIITSIRRWWDGEITGERCVKTIIDDTASIVGGCAGGVGGKIAGAIGGGMVFGPPGAVVGAVAGVVAGGVIGAIVARSLSELLTCQLFGLPQSEAVENAYKILGLSTSASNGEINSRFRHLSRTYHPDKGGDEEKFVMLQSSMEIIRKYHGL